MQDYHSPLKKYYILYSDVIYTTKDERIINNLKDCYYIKKSGSLIKPVFYVDCKEDNQYSVMNSRIDGYNQIMDLISSIDEEQYICFVGFNKSFLSQFIKVFNSRKGYGIEFSEIDFLDNNSNNNHFDESLKGYKK